MGHEAGHSFLETGVVLLAAALVFVLLFRRLGLGATLGYLVAGAVVGPQVLGLAGDGQAMIGIAELGIVMLLFVVGLELDRKRLWQMKGAIWPGRGAGGGLRAGGDRHRLVRGELPAGRSTGAGPAARPVLYRASAADAPEQRADANTVRRARLCHPAVSGPVDHPADHDRGRIGGGAGRRDRAVRLDAGVTDRGGHRGSDTCRPVPAAPASSA